jgi:hypothetical protein
MDILPLKALNTVLLVTIVEVLHLVFTTHTTYSILAQGYSDLDMLNSSPWSGSALPILNGIGELNIS